MKAGEADGVTGVICNVISFIAGANGVGGFTTIKTINIVLLRLKISSVKAV